MFLNSFQKTPKILDIPRTWISDCGETVAVTLMDIAVFRALIRFKSFFCVDIVNLKHLISISNVGTFKFDDQCLINQFRLYL